MLYTCALSGYKIKLSEFANIKIPNTDQFTHPIFQLSIDQLTRNKNKLNQQDMPLAILSLVYQFPELFIFNYTNHARINKHTCALFNKLLTRLPIIAAYSNLTLMPKFSISSESINNLDSYLVELEAAVKEYNQTEANRRLALKKHRRDEARKKLLDKTKKGFASKLANWTLDQLDLPVTKITDAARKGKNGKIYDYLSTYWKDIIRDITKHSDNIFHYHKKDVDELYDYCLEHIENDNDNAIMLFAVFNRANKKYNKLTEDLTISLGAVEGTPSKPVIDEEWIGKAEPVPKEYDTYPQYLVARAKWKVANNETK